MVVLYGPNQNKTFIFQFINYRYFLFDSFNLDLITTIDQPNKESFISISNNVNIDNFMMTCK